MIKILETELIEAFQDRMLEFPTELDEDMLFEEESKKEEDQKEQDHSDAIDKHKTEFDTFMLEQRYEDLQRMAGHMARIDGGLDRMQSRW